MAVWARSHALTPAVINDSDDGMQYSVVLDFAGAPPAVAEKILSKHSSLKVHVAPDFFERVRMPDFEEVGLSEPRVAPACMP